MASSQANYLILLLILIICGSRLQAADINDEQEDKILKALPSRFVGSLQTVIALVQTANSILGSLAPGSTPSRWGLDTWSAVHGCTDMVDLSDDVLHWSFCTINRNLSCAKIGTGDRISDLKTWLSATVTLLKTCLEDLDDVDHAKGHLTQLRTTLSDGSSQTTNLLNMFTQKFPNDQDQPKIAKSRFPSWVTKKDRKLLEYSTSKTGLRLGSGLGLGLGLGFVPNVVVAKDGTGNYTSIGDAIEAAPEYSVERYVIFVKRGVYEEVVEIKKKKWNIMLVGEGMNATILRWNRSANDGFKTYHTGTIAISGLGFIACNMSFENTAGPEGYQAVALRSDSDLSVYYKCGIYGYQDTLYMHSMRQFYRECTIKGTIDFIFGHGTVVLQNSDILVRKGTYHQTTNTITANGRYLADSSGFTIQSCKISPDLTLIPHLNYTKTYLGRPWKNYSRTVFMETNMSDIVTGKGWYPWDGREFLETVFCGEYDNYGPGAETAGRVNWPTVHVITDPNQASMFTVGKFIEGDMWLPSTGVSYNSGLEGGHVMSL